MKLKDKEQEFWFLIPNKEQNEHYIQCYKSEDVEEAVLELNKFLSSSRWLNFQNNEELDNKIKEIFGDFSNDTNKENNK